MKTDPPRSIFAILAISLLACLPAAHAAEDIDVFGGTNFSVEIFHNDTTPSTADGTDFGTATVNGTPVTKIYRIRNNGDDDLTIASGSNSNETQFTLAGLPGPTQPISPGGAVTFTIRFEPTTAGQFNATIEIVNTTPGENPFTFAIAGVGLGSPEIVVEGKYELSGNYGNVTSGSTTPVTSNGTQFLTTEVGMTRIHDFRIRNIGNSTLSVSMIDNSGHFDQIGWQTSVLAGTTDNFQIRFQPTSRGVKRATIIIDTNDADEDPFTFDILGNATAPDIEVRHNSIVISNGGTFPDFGTFNIDAEPEEKRIRLYNVGDIDLDITSASLSGPGASSFRFDNPITSAVTVGPGGTEFYGLELIFDPVSVGLKKALLTILSNDPDDTPFTFDVTGTGVVYPEINVQGARIGLPYANIPNGSSVTIGSNGTAFAQTDVGSFTDNLFRIQNNGNETLFHPTFTSSDPQFEIIGEDPFTTAGNDEEFLIRFRPSSYGQKSATITIENDDPDENPYTFKVSGLGFAPDIEVYGGTSLDLNIPNGANTPGTSDGTDFGTLAATGEVVVKNFRIRNRGTQPLTITGAAVDGERADSHYTLGSIPSPVEPIPPGGSDDFTIIFDPAWDGPLPGTVRLLTDAPEDPVFTFAITGAGIGTPELEVRFRHGDRELIPNGFVHDIGEVELANPGDWPSYFYDIELSNLGDGILDISRISLPSSIRLTSSPSEVRPGSPEEIQIQFFAQVVGPQTATLTLFNNDTDEDPFTLTIQAFGLGPDIAIAGGTSFRQTIESGDTTPGTGDGTDFGDVLLGSPPITRSFRIRNDGNRELSVVTGSVSDSTHFSISGVPGIQEPVFPVTTDEFDITFDPASLGQKSVTVQILSDDPDENPYTFTLTGNAVDSLAAPDIEIRGGLGPTIPIPSGDSTPSVSDFTDFGTATEGDSPIQRMFAIVNTGTANLNRIATNVSHPAVTVVGGSSSAIGPGRSIPFTVRIDPSTAGTINAIISVTSDDPNENPYVFLVRLVVEALVEDAPPRIGNFSLDASSATGSASFPTKTGKTYTLMTSTSMRAGTWVQVPRTISVRGTGNAETINFSFDLSSDPRRFYRIEEE